MQDLKGKKKTMPDLGGRPNLSCDVANKNRGHPNLRGANPCVGFSPFVDFFGVLSLFYEAGQPPSQLAREYAPMPNLSISSQGTT